jgi:hypothetical protein
MRYLVLLKSKGEKRGYTQIVNARDKKEARSRVRNATIKSITEI